jgi:hypothetical protein
VGVNVIVGVGVCVMVGVGEGVGCLFSKGRYPIEPGGVAVLLFPVGVSWAAFWVSTGFLFFRRWVRMRNIETKMSPTISSEPMSSRVRRFERFSVSTVSLEKLALVDR